jgi:hypothetical protein
MAAKKKCYWDGVEIQGLVNFQEITREKSTIDVPSFKIIRKIQSGITTLPTIDIKYEHRRGTNTLQFFLDFYNNDEVKDLEIVDVDATGTEYHRKLARQCECFKLVEPAYDAAAPEFASVTISVIPWEIIDL